MEQPRLDLWLKRVCLFKHRSEAAESCKGGLVKVNELRVKAASVVRIGDIIEVSEPRYRKVVVLEIPAAQVSKEQARTMYRDETPPASQEEKDATIHRDAGAGRPTKKERREIEKWRGRH